MPEPARLTDDEVGEWASRLPGHGLSSGEAQALIVSHEEMRARLAAAENVVEAMRVIREGRWAKHGYGLGSAGARECARKALAAYDAQKEPTGNHAESSATRGDMPLTDDQIEAAEARIAFDQDTTRGDTNK